ncbi:MAG: phytanoyl-CoA dioxygenase [Rhodospirillaceae bacterium]|nr:phytanoyl-CoA dioxygenase [Rhodospirillaceae bacterium]|tara:strand:- start:5389 stop:6279 length:891 start_codon:yes stop_codon:yes gene_type:complete
MATHALNSDQVEAYHRDGFLFPLPLLTSEEAADLRVAIESVQARAKTIPDMLPYTLNVPNLVIPEVNELLMQDKVLDRVVSIMGPDLMLWSASFFIKEANTTDFVSWHQDLRYWGLDDDAHELSVWVAVTDATPEKGAMRFVPGSHHEGLVEHRDTFADNNLLSRGQELAVDVDENAAVTVALKAGECSLHHGSLFHASGPNTTDDRRIGLVFRFITPRMRQAVGNVDYATLVRGEDHYGHFMAMPKPAYGFEPERIAAIDSMLMISNEYFFKDVEDKAPAKGYLKNTSQTAPAAT